MKKLILMILLTTSLAGLLAPGQGYFVFQTGKSQVWGGFGHLPTNVNVAFLWAANGSTPTVSSILTSTPTGPFPAGFPVTAAWVDVLTDPNFTLAVNNASGQLAIQPVSAIGSINYNAGSAFPVTGTDVGVTYTLFMLGWDGNYATPALAAAANAAIGWSSPFSYTAYALTVTPTSFAGLTGPFGIGTPEPSTMALAALSGLSFRLLRHRR